MNLHKYYAVIFTLCCVLLIETRAYPTLNIRRLFDSAIDSRYKKSDQMFPQADDDVLELEHLRRGSDDEMTDDISQQAPEQQNHHHHQYEHREQSEAEIPIAIGETDAGIHKDILPDLERQLESATASSPILAKPVKPPVDKTFAGQSEHEPEPGIPIGHRPPILTQNDGGKNSNQQQVETAFVGEGTAAAEAVPSIAKPFYGAARLAFGQNPEVLPTSSTTSTSTATTSTTTTTSVATAPANANVATDSINTAVGTQTGDVPVPSVIIAGHMPLHPLYPQRPPNSDQNQTLSRDRSSNAQHKETIGDEVAAELEATKTAARRSVTHLMTPKTAESLLRHKGGQYSSFDMAQYVYWTGDEAGVARAVEEFIEQGLMTRENALKFLRDIRLGIEYLQRSYADRVFPAEMRENNVKKSLPPPTTTTTSTTTTTTTTEKPFPLVHLDVDDAGRNNVHIRKALDSISIWNKLQEMNNEGRQELSDYDEAAGRAKIVEFLYKEYTLEEILYNLAKVMFTQSLAHGSDEAQQELQKLTDFLEREGNRGIIPMDLQKKVLHVLLSALADTLSERPELLPAARLNLGSSFINIPIRTYGTLK